VKKQAIRKRLLLTNDRLDLVECGDIDWQRLFCDVDCAQSASIVSVESSSNTYM